jgi:hypothetical protein
MYLRNFEFFLIRLINLLCTSLLKCKKRTGSVNNEGNIVNTIKYNQSVSFPVFRWTAINAGKESKPDSSMTLFTMELLFIFKLVYMKH